MERVHTDILQGYVIVSPVQYAYETVLVDLSFKMMQIKTLVSDYHKRNKRNNR